MPWMFVINDIVYLAIVAGDVENRFCSLFSSSDTQWPANANEIMCKFRDALVII
jgi:hypothetical protein